MSSRASNNSDTHRGQANQGPQGPPMGRGGGGRMQQAGIGPKEKPKNAVATVKRIWRYLLADKKRLLFVLVLVIFSSLLGLGGPYLLGYGVDEFLVEQQMDGFILFLAVLVGVYLFHSISLWMQNFWMIDIAQGTVYTMRKHLFGHLQKLPIAYFDHRQHGEIMSRLTNDIENISRTLNTSVIQVFSSLLILGGSLTIMILLSPLLTLITMIIIPIMYFGMKWITKRTREFFKVQQRNLGELNGFIEESVSGQSAVKMFSQEEQMMADFEEKNRHLRDSGYWAQTYSGFIPKLMNFLNNLSFAIVVGIGGVLALSMEASGVTIGVIVTFAELSRHFTRPLNDLANQLNMLLSAIAGAERVFEVLDEDEESVDESEADDLPAVEGDVVFDDVSFSYNKDQATIRHANIRVQAGETVALVGPTGAGKTTIINLLTRFYDADQGRITIDGEDITTIKRGSLRQHMGFVLQDAFLFQASIRDNIRYGRLEATDDEVEQAAKMANAHDFIMKQPDGYDTVLQQDGSGISQGQKQLLAIARAMLADPSIFILDEATSSIDTVTEMKIQQALYRLMEGRTCFVIAHRLNTIQNADQILVLQDGKIIENGTHHELLEERGFYYELYQSQLRNDAI